MPLQLLQAAAARRGLAAVEAARGEAIGDRGPLWRGAVHDLIQRCDRQTCRHADMHTHAQMFNIWYARTDVLAHAYARTDVLAHAQILYSKGPVHFDDF